MKIDSVPISRLPFFVWHLGYSIEISPILFSSSPGGNTKLGSNYTATCLPSRKLSKLDEPDIQDTAGEAETSS